MSPRLSTRTLIMIVMIVVITIVLRLYNLGSPVNDRHHFRQTDTLAIVRNFALSGGNILRPQFFQTPDPENTKGYYFGEFPIYEYFYYLIFQVTGESIVIIRLASIAMSVVSALGLLYIGTRFFDEKVGFAAAILFSVFPTSVFWGRAISPDMFAMMCFLISTAFLCHKPHGRSFWFSSLFFAAAVLTKPFYIAFALFHLAFFIYDGSHRIFENERKRLWFIAKQIILFYLIPVMTYLAWRGWAGTFPANTIDPDPQSILHNRQGWWQFWHQSDWITQLWYQRIFGELFTPFGGLLAVIGTTLIFNSHSRIRWHILFLLIGCFSIAYGAAWASRMHDYYLLMFLPVGALTAGYGLVSLVQGTKRALLSPANSMDKIGAPVAIIALIFFFYFLGVEKFATYTQAYFQPESYDLYSANFQQDYSAIQKLVPETATIVMVQDAYSPVAINYLQRRGNIIEVRSDEACPEEKLFFTELNHRRQLGAQAVFIKKNYLAESACPRAVLNQQLADRYPKIFTGKEFDGYQLTEPTLQVTGQGETITLVAKGVGSTARLEVGGIPGTSSTVLLYPTWVNLGDQTYTATVEDTSQWISFKLYWESPQITVEHLGWMLKDDGFLLKQN
jgi:4-amino-4-deoxy-L-arabinose transferase-like glycosyltransferase